MAKSIYTKKILDILSTKNKKNSYPFYYHFDQINNWRGLTKRAYYNLLRRLEKKGSVEIYSQGNEKFVKITSKGELELLVRKAKNITKSVWDGKWRLFIFDIPEKSHPKRDRLRRLLKSNEFYKLQASVFISPYNLNREAIQYLEQTGLIDFIRIMRVEAMDNDAKIRKYFNLS